MQVLVRAARLQDASSIARITNHYILHTTVHFGLDPWSEGEVEAARASGVEHGYPWLVAEDPAGEVRGYAKAGVWRSRPAYRFTTETGLYVDEGWRGRGIGRALYEALIAALGQGGFRTAVAGVTLPNPDSEALHLALGFERVGTFHRVGYKDGRWLDVAWFERPLGDAPPSGSPR